MNNLDATQLDYTLGRTDAVLRTQQSYNEDLTSVMDFGVVGDGSADDTDAFQKALNAVATTAYASTVYGHTLRIPADRRVRITGDITVPAGVSLVSDAGAGTVGVGSNSVRCVLRGGTILHDNDALITVMGGNLFRGVTFAKYGITTTLPNSSTFSGQCMKGAGEDISMIDGGMFGFNKGFTSDGYGRQMFVRVKADCVNVIDIANSFDVTRIIDCHFWPWLTVAGSSLGFDVANTSNYLYRAGTAIKITGSAWPKIEGTFNYGHDYGIYIDTVTNGTIINSGTECVRKDDTMLGTAGLFITGASTDTMVANSQFAHHNHCVYSAADAGTHQIFDHVYTRDGATDGIAVVTGDATLNGCSTVGYDIATSIGTKIVATAGKVRITNHHTRNESQGLQVRNPSTSIDNVTNSNTSTTVLYTAEAGTQFPLTAASTLAIRPDASTYHVSGTTGVSALAASYHGHVVTLVCLDGIVFTSSNGTNGVKVQSGAVSVPAGSCIQFVYCVRSGGVGTWRQVAQIVNSYSA